MLTIYTDGGADSRGNSGAACVIEGYQGMEPMGYATFLGSATNNEAEIFAALMGFAICNILLDRPHQEIKWVSDSEYSLKSATQYMKSWQKNGWQTAQKKPVKNQGLWRTFNAITKEVRIIPEHVRGHQGHPQNEACDTAVGWLRENAQSFKEGREYIDTEVCQEWMIIDGRGLLSEIRRAESRGLEESFVHTFFKNYLVDPSSAEVRSQAKPQSRIKENKPQDVPRTSIKRLTLAYLKKLEELDPSGEYKSEDPSLRKIIAALARWSKI